MAPAQSTSTSWWRQLCWDHPGYAAKTLDSFADGGSKNPSKPKVFCKACWIHRIEAEQRKDNEELSQGKRQDVRGQGMIEDYLWAFSYNTEQSQGSEIHVSPK
ncbi:hypothetical protein BD779DRAFT_1475814 [Infundibulicybe gibba]|nr:hypothetical protein BD779DRAFT_1475814 [Infundibulicybe gibba]